MSLHLKSGKKPRLFKKLVCEEKGSSLVELVMVMLLLMLFGLTIYTLIFAGSRTQQSINDKKDAQVDARIAVSYLNKWVKQNDVSGAVTIGEIPELGVNALVVRSYSEQYDFHSITWIYYHEGYIMEYLGLDEEDLPIPEYSTQIVAVEGLNLRYGGVNGTDERVIISEVLYKYDGQTTAITETLRLKAKLPAPLGA